MSEAPPQGATQPEGGFLFNVNLVFVSTVVSYGIGFLVVIVVARLLGPEGRGLTSLYQAGIGLGFAFLSLGAGVAAIYFVGRGEMEPRRALEVGLTVSLASIVLTALAAGMIALVFAEAVGAVPYWMAIVAVPAVIQFSVVQGVLRGQGRFGAMNSVEILQPLSSLVSLLLVEATVGLTTSRAIYALSLALVVPMIAGYVFIGRRHWPRWPAGLSLLAKTVRFGMQAQASNLVQLLNYRFDSYLVLLFVNTAGVGFYTIGVSLSEGLWFIANSVAVVLVTNLTAGDEEYAARTTPIVCRNTILVTAVASLGAAAVSPVVIPAVFGRAFEDAVVPFLWLLPGIVALSGAKIFSAYVFSRGRPIINAGIALAAFVVTVAADLVLIPAFEVTGAAAGASFGYGVSLVLSAIAYQRLSGNSIAEALLPRPSDAGLYVYGLRSLTARLRAGRHAGATRLNTDP